MKQLWAPWRSEYVSSAKDADCVFCSAPSKSAEEGLVLFNGSVSLVMLNKYPYNNGHLLLSPVRHVAKIEDLTPEESIDLFRLLRHSTVVLTRAFNPEGFNVGMNLGSAAGAGIADHLHMHIVPRWNGDTNFMPILSETKVVSEHLVATLEKLRPAFEKLGD